MSSHINTARTVIFILNPLTDNVLIQTGFHSCCQQGHYYTAWYTMTAGRREIPNSHATLKMWLHFCHPPELINGCLDRFLLSRTGTDASGQWKETREHEVGFSWHMLRLCPWSLFAVWLWSPCWLCHVRQEKPARRYNILRLPHDIQGLSGPLFIQH